MSSEVEINCIAVGMLEGNCYLVKLGENGEGIIIDPGDEAERIAEEVGAMSLAPQMILLTHGHIDHTNAAAALKQRYGCPVVCHAEDVPMVKGTEPFMFWGLQREPCEIDQEVGEGDLLEAGGRSIEVLHTPGHTPGSVCFLLGDVMFTGDVLFRESIGRTDLPGGSGVAMDASLKRLAQMEPKIVVCPGHGPETTIQHERRRNPFL